MNGLPKFFPRLRWPLFQVWPFATTFVNRHAETSKIVADGPCNPSTFQVDLGGPNINTNNSTVSGTVEGCTTGRFFIFGGANTRGSVTGAISFSMPFQRIGCTRRPTPSPPTRGYRGECVWKRSPQSTVDW